MTAEHENDAMTTPSFAPAEAVRDELKAARREARLAQDAVAAAQEEIRRVMEAAAAARERAANEAAAREQLEDMVAAREAEVSDLTQRLGHAMYELDLLRSSRSYRYTAPLRNLYSKLRR